MKPRQVVTLAEPSRGTPARRLSETPEPLTEFFQQVRHLTETLCLPLTAEDHVLQSMPDASPTKWHLAHTSWFFETFLLKDVAGYQDFHPRYSFLFNSYYNAVGERHERPRRGLLSRPPLSEIHAYRTHVDDGMRALLASPRAQEAGVRALIELGLHHEQQHQELILTDIKHAFGSEPLRPVYQEQPPAPAAPPPALDFLVYPEGLRWLGCEGGGFFFDNEGPRHRVFLESFALGTRLTTNSEYLAFMEDGGYRRPELWLSEGWETCRIQGWKAPLYWEERDGVWWNYTLGGERPVEPREPVCHVSYYEADAFARWSGARLPTEAEWETVAKTVPVEGNLLESRHYHPQAAKAGPLPLQLFGDVWEWTQSPYVGYPGFSPSPGAVGEYNGKFMCNQLVLRGGSCATPQGHLRPSYRNFFPPHARWQFSGIRLARNTQR